MINKNTINEKEKTILDTGTVQIIETDTYKCYRSLDYNFNFNKDTGYTETWGKTLEDDPVFAPGPSILDIEVTTKCNGPDGKCCDFCYKSNNPNGKNMSYKTFKSIIDKFPDTLQQIAFGADASCTTNPDIWDMMLYTRDLGLIPNITVADIDDDTADKLAGIVGGIAISLYPHVSKDICYDSVKRMTDRCITATNIHVMVSAETEELIYELFNDYINGEPRLKKLKAIVLLSLKQRGRGVNYNILSDIKWTQLIEFAMIHEIPIGFDTCSAPRYEKYLNSLDLDEETKYQKMQCLESCCGGRFSSYVNVDGIYYSCSFAEGFGKVKNGFSVLECNNFTDDIWNNPIVKEFGQCAIDCFNKGIGCQIFKV